MCFLEEEFLEKNVISASAAMALMSLGKARNEAAQIGLGKPVWQARLEHAPARTSKASHNNHSAVAARDGGLKETTESSAPASLRVAVQVERCADVEFPAAHPLFAAAIGRRHRLCFFYGRRGRPLTASNWRWRRRGVLRAECAGAGLAWLHAFGDFPPERTLFTA